MNCPKCKTENPSSAHFCSSCGTPLNQPQKSFLGRHKSLVIFLTLSSIFVGIIFLAIVGLLVSVGSALDEEEKQKGLISGSGDDIVAVLNIDGLIVEKEPIGGFGAFSEDITSARKIKKVLNEISEDPDVKVVLLRVNSPGGSAVASAEIFREITDFKQKTNKKVIAYFSDLAASGGYYVAMSADQIVANPSNITGSVGVIISYLNFKDLADKYGVKSIIYKSGPHKDIISEFRDPTTEESAIMQSLVDDAFLNFIKAVSKGRNLPEDEVKKLADGRVYSAAQAKNLKMIDEVGHFEDAVTLAKNTVRISDARVIEYGQANFWEFLLGSLGGKFNLSLMPSFDSYFNSQFGPKILYLYSL